MENPANEAEEKEPEDKVSVRFGLKCFDFLFISFCISLIFFMTLSVYTFVSIIIYLI